MELMRVEPTHSINECLIYHEDSTLIQQINAKKIVFSSKILIAQIVVPFGTSRDFNTSKSTSLSKPWLSF